MTFWKEFREGALRGVAIVILTALIGLTCGAEWAAVFLILAVVK